MTNDRISLIERLYGLLRRPARDVNDELRFHLDMRAEEAQRSGLSEEDARAAALERFGAYNTIQGELMRIDTARERRRDRREWVDDVRRDVVFALRALRRAPLLRLPRLRRWRLRSAPTRRSTRWSTQSSWSRCRIGMPNGW